MYTKMKFCCRRHPVQVNGRFCAFLYSRRAAVFSIGAFGDRWFKMCEANGVPADKFSSELGQITAPEEVDAALATGKYDVITITHNETATG